jgi:hypothetical protein
MIDKKSKNGIFKSEPSTQNLNQMKLFLTLIFASLLASKESVAQCPPLEQSDLSFVLKVLSTDEDGVMALNNQDIRADEGEVHCCFVSFSSYQYFYIKYTEGKLILGKLENDGMIRPVTNVSIPFDVTQRSCPTQDTVGYRPL